ncbi:hypothetical protein GCM10011324_46260 [Allosediminivita pacifica]|nr:hypothetical protein GCM10011324_46260 [Allosediminivita pacifica]
MLSSAIGVLLCWLARLRNGLMTAEFAEQFAGEVTRIMAARTGGGALSRAALASKLAKVETAIERLLDRLETEDASDAILARLERREAERDTLRAELSASFDETPVAPPSPAELEAIYRAQVTRLEDLLTGSDQMVAANALLRDLLGEVRVWGDPDARGGMRIELRGAASRLLQTPGEQQKSAPWGAALSDIQISVVAGVGFEPTTFRL